MSDPRTRVSVPPSRHGCSKTAGYRLLRHLALLAATVAVATACGSARPPGSQPGDDLSGLSEAFLALALPLDSSDLALADATYLARTRRAYGFSMAACLRDEGYRALADGLETQNPASRPGMAQPWLFPDLEFLRDHGGIAPEAMADPAATWPYLALFNWVEPDGTITPFGLEGVKRDLAAHPDVGVPPSEAEALLKSMSACEQQAAARVADYQTLTRAVAVALDYRDEWIGLIAALDVDDPTITAAADRIVTCLRAIAPEFDSVGGGPEFWTSFDAAVQRMAAGNNLSFAQLNEVVFRWHGAYADCVEPVIDARREPRTRLREETIEEDFVRLVSMEEQIDRALAEAASE